MNKTLIIIVVAGVIIALGGYLIHSFGNSKEDLGEAKNVAEVNKEIVRKVKRYEKAKIKVRTASDDELIRRYCKFVQSLPYDECVSSVRIAP